MVDILNGLAVAIGFGLSTGIKYFISFFMGYLGLKLASKLVGPLRIFEKTSP